MKLMTLQELVGRINRTPGIAADMQVAVIHSDESEYAIVSVWRCEDTGVLFIEIAD